MGEILRLLRPKQWTKNVFVFAAFLFTQGWRRPEDVAPTLLAFFAMVFASSAMYIYNDLRDVMADRAHPTKCQRPLASGAVSRRTAMFVMAVALVLAGGFASLAGWGVVIAVLAYVATQLLYNLWLKQIPVADVATIAIGFVLRVVTGAVAITVPLSGWILLCTAFLALLLGFGKRRHEYRIEGHDRDLARPALAGYTAASLDALLVFSAACAALSYGVYSIESRTAKEFAGLIMTTPFVIYGVMRYLVLALSDAGGEPESLVLRDVQLILSLAGFLVAALVALHGYVPPFVG